MMMPCPSPSGQVAPLLISLALGYGVLLLARREQRPLDRIGKIVGWLVMLVSLVGLICIACARVCKMCPSHRGAHSGLMCPVSGSKSACAYPPIESAPQSDSTPAPAPKG